MSASLSNAPSPPEMYEDVAPPLEDKSEELRDSGVWRLADAEPARAKERREDAELYARFSPIVRRISLKAVRSLPRSIAVDDIISAGWVGMSEAISRRPKDMPDEQFDAYASYRIRGAILDYLRALDPLSRRLRSIAREIHQATRTLTHRLGRSPAQDELAKEMGVPLEQLQRSLTDIQEAGMDRLDGAGNIEAPSASPSPEALATRSEMLETIGKYTKMLPERLQVVLTLHYQHECSLREIGEILGVTESRVCQLHAEAVQRIRARIEGRPLASARRRRKSTSK